MEDPRSRHSRLWQCDACAVIVNARNYGLDKITKIEADNQLDLCSMSASGSHKLFPVEIDPIYEPGLKYKPTFEINEFGVRVQDDRPKICEIIKLAEKMGLLPLFPSAVSARELEPAEPAPKLRKFSFETE